MTPPQQPEQSPKPPPETSLAPPEMPLKYQQVAGTPANAASEHAPLAELAASQIPAGAPKGPRARQMSQNTGFATSYANNNNMADPTHAQQSLLSTTNSTVRQREKLQALEMHIGDLVEKQNALLPHEIGSARSVELTDRIIRARRKMSRGLSELSAMVVRNGPGNIQRQPSGDRPLKTPTSATFGTMANSARDSPGARLSAAAPEFTPGSSSTAAPLTLPVVVGGPFHAETRVRRNRSNIDLHAVSKNAERRSRSRELSERLSISGQANGSGAQYSIMGPSGEQGGDETGAFEYQLPPGVVVPTVSVTTASPKNITLSGAALNEISSIVNARHNSSTATMPPDNRQMAHHHLAQAHQNATQQQIQQQMQQQPNRGQHQVFEPPYAPGMQYSINLPPPGTRNFNSHNMAPEMRPAPFGPIAGLPVFGPPHLPRGLPPVPTTHPINAADYNQQWPPLGQVHTAHAQAMQHAQARHEAEMQVHNNQLLAHQRHVQDELHAAMRGLNEVRGANPRALTFDHPAMVQVNNMPQNQTSGQASTLFQQHQRQQPGVPHNANSRSSRPMMQEDPRQAPKALRPPPGFEQPQQANSQGGSSLIGSFRGPGAGNYVQDAPGPSMAPAAPGVPNASKAPAAERRGQTQMNPHPQVQARVPSAASQASSAVSQPVGVEAATTGDSTGNVGGTMVGGVWYPPGRNPPEPRRNAAPKPSGGGGLGTPFGIPARPEIKTRPASPSWQKTDYELTGKWENLPEKERTPPHILRIGRLVGKDHHDLEARDLYERQRPFPSDGQGGAGFTQQARYNSFGAQIVDHNVPVGNNVPQPSPLPDIHADDPNNMSRPEMKRLVEYFDGVMDPAMKRRTWSNQDKYDRGEDDDDDSEDSSDSSYDSGSITPKASHYGLAKPNPGNPSLMEQRFSREPKPAPFDTQRRPLAQQLGFAVPAAGSAPILPSSMPTRHVSHGITNLFDNGSAFGSQPTSAALAGAGSFNPPSGTAVPHMWKSDYQTVRDDFRYVSSQAHYLGFGNSPAFPETAAQFASIRADQKNRAADMLSKQIGEKEMMLTNEGRAKKVILEAALAKASEVAARSHQISMQIPHEMIVHMMQLGPAPVLPQVYGETYNNTAELLARLMSGISNDYAAVPKIDPKKYNKYHLSAHGRPSRFFPKLLDEYGHLAPPGMFQSGGPNQNAERDVMSDLIGITGVGPTGRPLRMSEAMILNRGPLSAKKALPRPVGRMLGSQFRMDLGDARFESLYDVGQYNEHFELRSAALRTANMANFNRGMHYRYM